LLGATLVFEYSVGIGLALSLEALTFNNRWESGKYNFSGSAVNFKIG
jgi:hypothetical protein